MGNQSNSQTPVAQTQNQHQNLSHNSDNIIFSEVKSRLSSQQISINSIDTKAALTLSFVGAILAGLVNSSWFLKLDATNHLVLLVSFGITALLALAAVLVRDFRQDPDPKALISQYASRSETYTKGQLTANFADSYYHNARIIKFKGWLLKIGLACLAVSIFIFCFSLFFSLHSVTMKSNTQKEQTSAR